MRFVLLTALRETRSAWKRLVFFFVCIAIGVGAIVALRSVIQSVRGVLSTEARTLIAADILLWTDRPWQTGHDRAHRGARRGNPGLGTHRIDRDADDGPAVSTRAPASRRSSSCEPSSPDFRFTDS